MKQEEQSPDAIFSSNFQHTKERRKRKGEGEEKEGKGGKKRRMYFGK